MALHAADVDLCAVAAHHAIDRGEPEAGAALALGGEERLHAAPPHLVVHADAGVGDRDLDIAGVRALVRRRQQLGAQRQGAAARHRVDRIQHQIDQGLANLAFDAGDGRQLGGQIGTHGDDVAALARHAVPARMGEVDDLQRHGVDLHRQMRRFRRARAVEFPHARDGLGDAFHRALDGLAATSASAG